MRQEQPASMNRTPTLTVAEFRKMTAAADDKFRAEELRKMLRRDSDTWEARIDSVNPLTVWICIPRRSMSLNEWTRKHWRVHYREVREMTANMQALVAVHKLPRFEKAEVRIVYYFRDNRRRDTDNFTAKFIDDALRYAGIIADDNAGVLKLHPPEFRVDRERPRTEVFVSDWSEERGAEK